MVLGIDIGGTNIKFGIVDENYQLVQSYIMPTEPERGDMHIVDGIIRKCREIERKYSFDRIGIGTPGKVDYERGICVRSSNIPYNNTPLKSLIEEAMKKPVRLGNDATCAVYGELHAGMGRQYRSFIMITLGTGVGGGIVINGQPYQGKSGGAGEVGHMIVQVGGLPCSCGQKGCYEQYASVTALIRQTKMAAKEHPESLLAEIIKNGVTGRSAFDAMQQGCGIAADVVAQYIEYIATGIKSLIWIFQPEAVVLGGAITNQDKYLLEPLQEKVGDKADICISPLKNDAGVIGAAAWGAEATMEVIEKEE